MEPRAPPRAPERAATEPPPGAGLSDAVGFAIQRLVGERVELRPGGDAMPADEDGQRSLYAELLAGAYHDFVRSDARREKVFRVFRAGGPRTVFVPLDSLRSTA